MGVRLPSFAFFASRVSLDLTRKASPLSNEDVQRCGCNGYALTEIVQSSGPDLYMVGNMDVTQQAFNRTANNGLARGAKTSTPWIWLGGGYRQDIATDGGFVMDFVKW